MSSRPRRDRPLDFVAERALDLPAADQVRLVRILVEALGADAAPVQAQARTASVAEEALEHLARAAEHHGLPPKQAPTAGQYDQASKALGLWSKSKVGRAWNTWRYACAAYEGRPHRESAARARDPQGKHRPVPRLRGVPRRATGVAGQRAARHPGC